MIASIIGIPICTLRTTECGLPPTPIHAGIPPGCSVFGCISWFVEWGAVLASPGDGSLAA